MLSLLYLVVKAQQHFVTSSCVSLDEKTALEIRLNPGLNLTIFRGTRPRLLVVLTTLPKVKSCNIPLMITSSSSHKTWVTVRITVCSAHRIVLPGAVKSTFAP